MENASNGNQQALHDNGDKPKAAVVESSESDSGGDEVFVTPPQSPDNNDASSPERNVTAELIDRVSANDYDGTERLILRHGALVNDGTDANGDSPLLIACKHGNKRMAKLLLRYGADLDSRNVNRIASSQNVSIR